MNHAIVKLEIVFSVLFLEFLMHMKKARVSPARPCGGPS